MAVSKASAGAVTGATVGATVMPCDGSVLRLQVEEVTYLNHHNINNDTVAEFGAPQWRRGRLSDPSPAMQAPAQYPVAYTRASRVKLIAKFTVLRAPQCPTAVWIKGIAKITESVTMTWVKLVTVQPNATSVVVSDMLGDAPLPDHISYYEPFWIDWIYNTGTSTATRQSAGFSVNPLYVLLGDPIGTLFWSSVYYSCHAAHGRADPDGAVKAIYSIFEKAQASPPQPIKRKRDGMALKYWNPRDDNQVRPMRRAGRTGAVYLLSSSIGNARCGEWSQFMVDICRNHHITGAKQLSLYIEDSYGDLVVGMLVKNWTFGPSPRTSPFNATLGVANILLTHQIAQTNFFDAGLPTGECINAPGIPAQGNPDPQPFFWDHAIVKYSTASGTPLFYDPSYGTRVASSELEWEKNSLDGVANSAWVAGRHPGVKVFVYR